MSLAGFSSVISHDDVIKVWLSKTPANDTVVADFMLKSQTRPIHAPLLGRLPVTDLLQPGKWFVWDRLGRAGTCANPTKQHYNGNSKRRLAQKQVQEMKLPVKGHEANPVEIFNGYIQREVAR